MKIEANGTQRFLIGMYSAALILPLDLAFGQLDPWAIPPAILVVPFGVYYFIKSQSIESGLIFLSFVLSLIAVFVTSLGVGDLTYRPLGSVLFLFLPVTSYFLAKKIFANTSVASVFFNYSSKFGILLAFAVAFSIVVQYDGQVRTEGTLNGQFFGVPLYGAYGVHTLCAHYFLVGAIVGYRLLAFPSGFMVKAFSVSAMIIMFSMIFLSLSRGDALAVLALATIYIVRRKGYIWLAALSITLAVIAVIFSQYISPEDNAIMGRLIQSIEAVDLNELSSNRVELVSLAVRQLIGNPIFGTGFHGYVLDYLFSDNVEDLLGHSTHIYVLTIIWKMGLLAATPFFFFGYRIFKKSLAGAGYGSRSAYDFYVSTMAAFFIINLFWDALLAVNLMILVTGFICAVSNRNSWQMPIRGNSSQV